MSGEEDPKLDGLLGAWRAPAPSGALVGRVMAAAPGGRSARAFGGWLTRLGFGAGLAAAGVVGLSVGIWTAELRAQPGDDLSAAFAGYDLSGLNGPAEES